MNFKVPIKITIFYLCLSVGQVFGQTAGATAPEVTQFEPVDTTDLVNLLTGDFTYSIPAIVIPGAPGGAYPISLSYHSGIPFNEEASWVGLGWNLWPGSITRTVQGLPDEYSAAQIERYDELAPVYSYTVGFGYANFSAGVDFDNNGGFGGYVGLGLSGAKVGGQSIVGATLRAGNGEVGFSVGVQITRMISANVGYHTGHKTTASVHVGQEIGQGHLGLSAGTHSGVSLGYSSNALNTGMTLGISLDSHGPGFFFGNLNSRRLAPPDFGSSFNTVSTPLLALDTPYFSFGYYRTQHWRRETSYGYGALSLSQLKNQGLGIGSPASPLDRMVETTPGSQEYRDLVFDFRMRHYLATHSRYDKYYNQKLSYLSDYVAVDFDDYMVSAQGASGRARHVLGQRGWIIPSDQVLAKDVGDGELHPYGELLAWMEGETWPNYSELLKNNHQGWEPPAVAEPTMVFMDDPGYDADPNLYDQGFLSGDRYYPQSSKIHNRSQLIDYSPGLITVTKPDGVRYLFGRSFQGIQPGAKPEILTETNYSKTTDTLQGGGSAEATSWTQKHQKYGYAWHLAAIESPDYLDRTQDGYSADDFGSFVAFTYTEINPKYHWQTPWHGTDERAYLLSGVSSDSDRKYQFEAMDGLKNVWVPHLAITKTHVAVFNIASRKDSRSAENIVTLGTLDETNNPRYWMEAIDCSEIDFASSTVQYEGRDIPIPAGSVPFLLPLGLATQQAMEIGAEFRAKVDFGFSGSPSFRNFKYLGALPYRDKGLFVVLNPPGTFTECLFGENEDDFLITYFSEPEFQTTPPRPWSNGMARLEGIHLYDRVTFEYLLNQFTEESNLNGTPLGTYTPGQFTADSNYLLKVAFNHDYSLRHHTPNTELEGNPDRGKLTLTGVDFYVGQEKSSPGYRFQYYADPAVPQADRVEPFRTDPWGFYSPNSWSWYSKVDDSTFGDVPIQAMWSLSGITTPVGAHLNIQYELDRYAWVQDRPAFDPILPAQENWLDRSQIDGLVPWGGHGPGSGPPTSAGIIGDANSGLLGIDISLGTDQWKEHIILSARYRMAPTGPLFRRNFVLPLQVQGSNFRLARSQALTEFVSWLIHEHYHLGITGDDTTNQAHEVDQIGLVPIPLDPSGNHPLQVADSGLIGRPGGGLRTKSITLSEDGTPGSDAFTMQYFYTRPGTWKTVTPSAPGQAYLDLATGVETGVIFTDPPNSIGGNTGHDARIIRAEEHPYQNMPGSEVFYEYVTVRTMGTDPQDFSAGMATYHFATPRLNRVIRPFAPDENTLTGTIETSTSNPLNPSDYQVTLALYNTGSEWDHPVDFTLEQDTRKLILNNASYLGRLLEVTQFDSTTPQPRPISKKTHEYKGNFDDAPLLKTFSLDSSSGETGKLVDTSFSKPQGVHVAKSQALLLTAGGAGFNEFEVSSVKVFMMDEVFNTFRETSVTVTEFDYPPNQVEPSRVIQSEHAEHLAFDYYTGTPVLSKQVLADSDGHELELYNLSVTAHQIYPFPSSNGQKLLLTQPGFQLSAMVRDSSNRPSPETFLDDLWNAPGSRGHVVSANLTHWHEVRPSVWVQDANFSFVHDSKDKTSQGWRFLGLLTESETGPQQHLLKLDQIAQGPLNESETNGRWISAGQNTIYDEQLNAIEHRDLNGLFHAAYYTRQNTLPAANIANAQLSQVFYQGFENGQGNASNSGYFNNPADTVYHSNNYLENFAQVYTGTGSFKGDYSTPVSLQNSYGLGSADGPYWLRFYVNHEVTFVSTAGYSFDLTANPLPDGVQVLPVDNGWRLIQIHIDGAPSSLNIDLTPDSGHLDDVALFPAAQHPIAHPHFRTTATLSHFGYNPRLLKVNSITDSRGRTVRYEYEARGRLFKVYDATGALSSEYHLSYRQQNLDGSNP